MVSKGTGAGIPPAACAVNWTVRGGTLALVGVAERLTTSGDNGEMGIVGLLGFSPLIIFEPSAARRKYQSAGRPS